MLPLRPILTPTRTRLGLLDHRRTNLCCFDTLLAFVLVVWQVVDFVLDFVSGDYTRRLAPPTKRRIKCWLSLRKRSGGEDWDCGVLYWIGCDGCAEA